MKFDLPEEVRFIIDALEKNGHDAYVVGGCVRDSLAGNAPKDWDICTSALPEQTMECFEGCPVFGTGLQHGTVTLISNHKPYEITTFRHDGDYSDNRRPDTVEFVKELKEDMARRDFTINAMAFNPGVGVIDLFGGKEDLRNGIIKCVGDASGRFQEDALRIIRAMRFASELGFSIDDDTARAMLEKKALLRNIAVERIAAELDKLIVGMKASETISRHISVITEVIPELIPTIGFEQNNPYHCFDVFAHTMKSVDSSPKDVVIRLTMLFHDIAKPQCYTEKDGVGHFYGHPKVSSEIARQILSRLKYDNDTKFAVTQLVFYHDTDIDQNSRNVKRWLNRIGEERLRQLLLVKRSDAIAQSPEFANQKLAELENIEHIIDKVIAEQHCFSLKGLAVDGKDLIAAGIPEGAKIGAILKTLVDAVIEEQVENDKDKLMDMVRTFMGAVREGSGMKAEGDGG